CRELNGCQQPHIKPPPAAKPRHTLTPFRNPISEHAPRTRSATERSITNFALPAIAASGVSVPHSALCERERAGTSNFRTKAAAPCIPLPLPPGRPSAPHHPPLRLDPNVAERHRPRMRLQPDVAREARRRRVGSRQPPAAVGRRVRLRKRRHRLAGAALAR